MYIIIIIIIKINLLQRTFCLYYHLNSFLANINVANIIINLYNILRMASLLLTKYSNRTYRIKFCVVNKIKKILTSSLDYLGNVLFKILWINVKLMYVMSKLMSLLKNNIFCMSVCSLEQAMKYLYSSY